MPADSSRSIKAIAILGLVAFAFLWLSSLGLKRGLQPDESERVLPTEAQSPFRRDRAMEVAMAQTALGPRPADSPAQVQAMQLIKGKAEAAGLEVNAGDNTSLTARCRGSLPGNIVFLTHLDTPPDSPGANASASGSAVLAELATLMGRSRKGMSVVFVWLSFGERQREGGWSLPPIQALLEPLDPKAIFVVEQVGDCYLELGTDPAAPAMLQGLLQDTAERLGYGRHFPAQGPPLKDVYQLHAFHNKAVYLGDPLVGGSIAQHARLRGTAEDTIDHLCPDSLQAVGDVLYHAIMACDSFLPGHS
jgi:hypothetical protein